MTANVTNDRKNVFHNSLAHFLSRMVQCRSKRNPNIVIL